MSLAWIVGALMRNVFMFPLTDFSSDPSKSFDELIALVQGQCNIRHEHALEVVGGHREVVQGKLQCHLAIRPEGDDELNDSPVTR